MGATAKPGAAHRIGSNVSVLPQGTTDNERAGFEPPNLWLWDNPL